MQPNQYYPGEPEYDDEIDQVYEQPGFRGLQATQQMTAQQQRVQAQRNFSPSTTVKAQAPGYQQASTQRQMAVQQQTMTQRSAPVQQQRAVQQVARAPVQQQQMVQRQAAPV